MLIRKSTSVGFQCCVCGMISTYTMELFELGRKQRIIFACPKCGSEIFRAEKDKKGGYNVEVACPVCFTPHRYNMNMLQFWQSDIFLLKCAFENSESLIFGRADRVEAAVHSVFEPFEPFLPEEHYLEDFGDYVSIDERRNPDFEQAADSFLRYLRLINSDENEFLSVEDVLDSSYISDYDMKVVRLIINICRLIEFNKVECVCGECGFEAADIQTRINDNVLSVTCTRCGRGIDIDFSREDIMDKFTEVDCIKIT